MKNVEDVSNMSSDVLHYNSPSFLFDGQSGGMPSVENIIAIFYFDYVVS